MHRGRKRGEEAGREAGRKEKKKETREKDERIFGFFKRKEKDSMSLSKEVSVKEGSRGWERRREANGKDRSLSIGGSILLAVFED